MKACRTPERLLKYGKKQLISRSPLPGQLPALVLTAAAFCCRIWSPQLILAATRGLSALAATLPSRSRI